MVMYLFMSVYGNVIFYCQDPVVEIYFSLYLFSQTSWSSLIDIHNEVRISSFDLRKPFVFFLLNFGLNSRSSNLQGKRTKFWND